MAEGVDADDGADDPRVVVRAFEVQIAVAGPALAAATLVDGLHRVSGLDLFESARSLEELGTRLGSSSQYAARAFRDVTRHPELSPVERAVAGIASAIGFRRAGSPADSNLVLEQIVVAGLPWPYFPALILHLRSINYLGSDLAGLRKGITLSEEANRLLPNSPGFMHALAHLLLEEGIWSNAAPEVRQATWSRALALVDRALAYVDWPKFHFTRGRILLRLGTSEEHLAAGMNELRAAANGENKAAFDSAERRIQYALELSLAELRVVVREGQADFDHRLQANLTELQRRSESTARELEEKVLAESRTAQNQAITIIGFVVVALSLLPLSTSIFGFVDSIGLPMVLLGIGVYAVILFGAVALATWSLNRGLRRSLTNLRASYPPGEPRKHPQ